MLINRTWQPIPGTESAWIYPYIRRPDILSSNSFLIRTPEQLILIDAGALPAQTADLLRVTNECRRELNRPLTIFLTHCHLDHCLQATAFQEGQIMPAWVAIQELGAKALSRMDARTTAANLYGLTMPFLDPGIRLLTEEDRASGRQRRIRLSRNVVMTIDTVPVPINASLTEKNGGQVKQVVSIGGNDHLEVYSTPGHSPDSVCIRIGELLFIGDLLAATYPLVAGSYGWNRDQLVNSLDQIVRLLDNESIRLCCPAHGGLLPADKTRELLLGSRSMADNLNGLSEVNEQRLFETTELALELIDEAEEVFSAIAGRLLYVAHRLDALEEEEAADRCRAAMRMEQIDACLADFRNLCQALASGETLRVVFTSEALHVVDKVNKLFDVQALAPIIPSPLLSRASCLLLDFLAVARGIRNLEEFIPTDLNALLAGVDQTWRLSPHQDEAILDHVEDRERYLAELARRIGHPSLAERAPVIFSPGENPPIVRVAEARLLDTLIQFLEWLSLAKPASIALAANMNPDGPSIVIAPEDWNNSLSPHQEKMIAAFARRLRIAGMILRVEPSGFGLRPVPALA